MGVRLHSNEISNYMYMYGYLKLSNVQNIEIHFKELAHAAEKYVHWLPPGLWSVGLEYCLACAGRLFG